MNEHEIQALIAAYYGCDREAGEELCRQLYPEVRMRIACRGVHRRDIDDVTQEVVIRVVNTKWGTSQFCPDQGGSFGAWLRPIVGNIAMDSYRRRQRIQTHEVPLDEDPPARDPSSVDLVDQQDEQDAQFRALRAWLAHLTDRQREVMEVILDRLGANQELPSYEEIATGLGITASNVGAHRSNAIQTLREFATQPPDVEIDTCRNR
jgi:RNA polymerase sigma factor (sigma-70 family)